MPSSKAQEAIIGQVSTLVIEDAPTHQVRYRHWWVGGSGSGNYELNALIAVAARASRQETVEEWLRGILQDSARAKVLRLTSLATATEWAQYCRGAGGAEAQRRRGAVARRRRGEEAQRRSGAEVQWRGGAEAQRRSGAKARWRRAAVAQRRRGAVARGGAVAQWRRRWLREMLQDGAQPDVLPLFAAGWC
jgi:hypothetical protein